LPLREAETRVLVPYGALGELSGDVIPPLSDLCEALLVCTARMLAGIDGRDAAAWLLDWGQDAAMLLQRYPGAVPLNLAEHGGELSRLAGMAQNLIARAANDARSGLYNLMEVIESNVEEEAIRISELRASLVQFAACPEGQQVIEQFTAAVLPDPYPYYRNHALATLGVAALAAPEAAGSGQPTWVRRRLREMLAVALYGEGVGFTFDLPAMLLAAPHPPSPEADQLRALLAQAQPLADRWGTQLRAASALGAARYRADPGSRGQVLQAFRDAVARPLGYAGYASLGLLSLANRCIEMGVPLDDLPVHQYGRTSTLLDEAVSSAAHVRDLTFRARRVLLVQTYRERWLPAPPPDPTALRVVLAQMPDRDMRLAYIEHLSARWLAPDVADGEALRELVPLALSDATTLDAVLARLVGRRLQQLTPSEVGRMIVVCACDLATGRPWDYGVRPAAAGGT